MRRNATRSEVLRTSSIGVFAALYTIASVVPISVFIGASSLLTLNLIVTPVIAILLTPIEATSAALIGALLALWISPHQAMFGPATLLLPVMGAVCGSLVFHKPKFGVPISAGFLLAAILAYLATRSQFAYWISPHVLALVLAGSLPVFTSSKYRVPIASFISTMCEQAVMMILAVYVLQLPAFVFVSAFPLMLYERAIGTAGAVSIAFACARFAPAYFGKI